jgi:hypothetical protein
LESERVELESVIKYLKTVLEDPKVAWKEILDETSELKKKFATPRKSVIVKSDGALNDEDVRPCILLFFSFLNVLFYLVVIDFLAADAIILKHSFCYSICYSFFLSLSLSLCSHTHTFVSARVYIFNKLKNHTIHS